MAKYLTKNSLNSVNVTDFVVEAEHCAQNALLEQHIVKSLCLKSLALTVAVNKYNLLYTNGCFFIKLSEII